VSRQHLRSWEFSNVYAKGTYWQARSCAFLVPMLLATASLLVSDGLLSGARAATDLASRVGLRVVARPGSASDSSHDFELRNGGVLRTGDGVQLHLESDADAYVYVIAYGSSHKAILLQPFSGRAEDARVRPGRFQVIPGADVFLPLDHQEGYETLFTIVAEKPLADVAGLIARIDAQGDDLAAINGILGESYPGFRRLTFKHIGAKPLVGVTAVVPRASTSAQSAPAANADSGAEALSGNSQLPPAGGAWAVSSNRRFGRDEAPTAPAAPPQPGASAALGDAGSAPVSAALRKAREAAGIDESEFRGILASLPASGEGGVPTSLRKPYKEQGVLSAEGSRIRPMGRVELGSDVDKGSQN
jgi:hypothetical protein